MNHTTHSDETKRERETMVQTAKMLMKQKDHPSIAWKSLSNSKWWLKNLLDTSKKSSHTTTTTLNAMSSDEILHKNKRTNRKKTFHLEFNDFASERTNEWVNGRLSKFAFREKNKRRSISSYRYGWWLMGHSLCTVPTQSYRWTSTALCCSLARLLVGCCYWCCFVLLLDGALRWDVMP